MSHGDTVQLPSSFGQNGDTSFLSPNHKSCAMQHVVTDRSRSLLLRHSLNTLLARISCPNFLPIDMWVQSHSSFYLIVVLLIAAAILEKAQKVFFFLLLPTTTNYYDKDIVSLVLVDVIVGYSIIHDEQCWCCVVV